MVCIYLKINPFHRSDVINMGHIIISNREMVVRDKVFHLIFYPFFFFTRREKQFLFSYTLKRAKNWNVLGMSFLLVYSILAAPSEGIETDVGIVIFRLVNR